MRSVIEAVAGNLMAIGLITGGIGLTLIIIVKLLTPHVSRIRGIIGEWRVRKIIKRCGLPALHDFIAEDQNGGLTQIDHAVKVPAGVVIIETKNISGKIYGEREARVWTVFYGPIKHRIQNPIRQNYRHLATLQERHPTVDFLNLICCIGGKFPRGIPSGVTTDQELPRILQSLKEVVIDKAMTDEVESTWADLEQLAASNTTALKHAHITQLRERFARQGE